MNMGLLLWVSRKFENRLKIGDILLVYLIVYPLGRFLLGILAPGCCHYREHQCQPDHHGCRRSLLLSISHLAPQEQFVSRGFERLEQFFYCNRAPSDIHID